MKKYLLLLALSISPTCSALVERMDYETAQALTDAAFKRSLLIFLDNSEAFYLFTDKEWSKKHNKYKTLGSGTRNYSSS